MLVSHTERPRELKWYHAGPMLYGDWGTSRFYVLGLALFYALHASFWYVFAVGLLVAAVGWAYTIICRCYPDGGGVYSAAKHTNRQLAVVGALLLFADYLVTAALSAYDGIRYMGFSKDVVPYLAMLAILAVGLINYIGPRKAGAVALVIAIATLILTAILTVFSIPHLADGWAAIHKPTESLPIQWSNFVAVVLALSGVEAVANMTGIMVPPVTRTANKAIWPVLCEVVILNVILAVAMNGLPRAGYDLGAAPGNAYAQVAAGNTAAAQHGGPEGPAALAPPSPELQEHIDDTTDAVLRVMAKVYVDPYLTLHLGRYQVGIFSLACGIVFGFLLLSAVNTAVADMISIQYVMSRDTELPHVLTRLNKFGVPWLTLVAAVTLPVALLGIFPKLEVLANLYAVGVVGAIAINLGSCTFNRQMPVKTWERAGMALLAAILLGIEATLVYQKPDARYFAAFVLCAGLAARFFTKTYPRLTFAGRGYSLATWAALLITAAGLVLHFEGSVTSLLQENVSFFKHGAGYATYIFSSLLLMFGGTSATYSVRYLTGKVPVAAPPLIPGVTAPGLAPIPVASENVDLARPHVLVATRGGKKLLDFAANYCRKTNAVMFVLFVRQINVTPTGGAVTARNDLQDDPDAVKAFTQAAETCARHGVQMMPMYVVSPDVPYTILDFAATYGVEAVLMGVSRVGSLLRALRGDVITAVADNLPEDISLLIHA